MVEQVGPAQAPAVPIVILGLQEALAQILTVCTSLAKVISVPAAAATSQAGGGTQIPPARTPEQVGQGLQTPGVLPAQPIAIALTQVGLVMSDEEHKILERFGRLQPPSFSGADSENAQDFLDRLLETYERSRPVGEAPLSWNEFSVLFLEKFVPPTHGEELHRQFEQPRQEGIYVTQYEMRFSELYYHVVWLVPTERERIRRFIDGLNYQLHFVMTRESVSGARFDEVVDIARRLELFHSQEYEEREAKRPRGSGGFCGVSSGGQSHHSRGHPYRPTQTSRPAHRGASVSHGSYNAHLGQSSFSALPAQSSHHDSSAQVSTGSSSSYQEQQFRQRRGYFECGDLSHLKRDCPRLLSGVPQQSSIPMIPTPAVTPPAQPARGRGQVARGRPRGGGRSGGGQARFYAIPARPGTLLLTQ
ncbi:uncharacterized protein [Nicotiana tomentosiformis]|uniref:uncharacterized protein n=1 Tax=Nicotiana tomentosiformis TaxID=4098 RepID=UPI00388C50D2